MRGRRISHRSFAPSPATSAIRTADVRIHRAASGRTMIDVLLLALGVGLFGLMAAYVASCERV
jgi:hypothetical protein